MKSQFAKIVWIAGTLALATQVSATTNSMPHVYMGDLKMTLKIGSDLYETLDAKYQKSLQPVPVTLVSMDAPAIAPTQDQNARGVAVSLGFISLINRIAHAKAIDHIEPGYFNQYVTLLGNASTDENPPELPGIENSRYWTDDVMNDQSGFFNQMMGLTTAINLAYHYLGSYNKYASQMSGKLVPINTFLTQSEWESGLKAATENSLECAFGTEGGAALFEAIGKMPHRPAWANYIIPQNVDIRKTNKRLAKYEVDFFHGDSSARANSIVLK